MSHHINVYVTLYIWHFCSYENMLHDYISKNNRSAERKWFHFLLFNVFYIFNSTFLSQLHSDEVRHNQVVSTH